MSMCALSQRMICQNIEKNETYYWMRSIVWNDRLLQRKNDLIMFIWLAISKINFFFLLLFIILISFFLFFLHPFFCVLLINQVQVLAKLQKLYFFFTIYITCIQFYTYILPSPYFSYSTASLFFYIYLVCPTDPVKKSSVSLLTCLL